MIQYETTMGVDCDDDDGDNDDDDDDGDDDGSFLFTYTTMYIFSIKCWITFNMFRYKINMDDDYD